MTIEFSTFLKILGTIFFAIGILHVLYTSLISLEPHRQLTSFGFIVIGVILLFSGANVSTIDALDAAFTEEQNRLNHAIESDYTVYLEGNEVDIDTVDLSQWNVSLDDEKEAIYLAPKSTRHSYYIPIYYN